MCVPYGGILFTSALAMTEQALPATSRSLRPDQIALGKFVTSRAVGPSRLISNRTLAAQSILPPRHQLQMIWIHAGPHATQMIEFRPTSHPLWKVIARGGVSDSVCEMNSTIHPELSVAI